MYNTGTCFRARSSGTASVRNLLEKLSQTRKKTPFLSTHLPCYSNQTSDRPLLMDRDSNCCQLSRVFSLEFSTRPAAMHSRQSRSRPGANSNGERGERHCRRTVSCALGAPVKTIVSTQLTHGWPVGSGRCWPVEGTLQAATSRARSRGATAVASPRLCRRRHHHRVCRCVVGIPHQTSFRFSETYGRNM